MAKNNEICTAVSISECAGKGTIGGYTMNKETTMKQIDTTQLNTAACQAQAAEFHARGFNCGRRRSRISTTSGRSWKAAVI